MNFVEIEFGGLKNKIYSFEYNLDKLFFDKYDDSPISDGRFKAKINFDKKDSFIIVDFEVDGELKLVCDRCLESLMYEMLIDFRIFVKFEQRDNKIGDEEDVIYLPKLETKIVFDDIIFDYLVINLPVKIVHKNIEDCNEKMIQKLNNNNIENKDPRWEILNKLKN